MAEQGRWIVHILSKDEWEQALNAGEYRPASLDREGFIHYSRPGQVLKTANDFYAAREDLLLLWVNPDKLGVPLKWESADGDTFPHGYGPLSLDAVIAVRDFLPGPSGRFDRAPQPPESGESELE